MNDGIGAVLGQLGNDGGKVDAALSDEHASSDQFIGFWICLAYAMLSAVAGVFTEVLHFIATYSASWSIMFCVS
jgi:hypothetical protein